ncbi:hypothetical protein GGE16_001210 [Rhizobium leguminosarum]|uniref:Uncharacterized protein n=1 Tax=Rhizobium leguminosarum TaxID=384 RepID=A0AAE2MH27_RHILE|nr:MULTISPECIES: hypothetical protein [Rhizobium]MBB4289194.1 hypothetical protein [Rhizobium leguminosarum]MBB4294712.1 hypothetical protein [Rhizobium leguminosarum]MBB4306106.1 hypothetical protein [Rhizobium leguminosarum]MBB4418315.1 hypothetical protein [Rhizobium leguminosarum]MBB4433160.1 hypothetical protein [Rhizobium esperanzae]
MLLNWVVLFNELQIYHRRVRRDPFADPLEGPEWRGFLWAASAIARLAARRGEERKTLRPDKSQTEKGLSFRSSVAARGAGIPD